LSHKLRSPSCGAISFLSANSFPWRKIKTSLIWHESPTS